ncbi:MAG: SDR family oxidoreductase [Alphaproteobacteria bacterium]|nr:SDR family oxidoreductase [Alphaproteobacteria bacterium]MCB9928559.1 SDR family oxidoreductase [Alphaproteobacteria bacterium]
MHIPSASGLKDKVAIVVGGGARGDGIGNGRAACLLLAAEGAKVLVVDRDEALAGHTARMIQDNGGTAAAFAADVTQSADCKALVDRALSLWGRVDCLDNNVGIGSRGTVVEETEEEWDRVMQVNVKTMMLTAKHAVPAMAESGGGAIVNISSISALRPRGLTAYSASKGAVIALSRAMAVDHAPEGIRVNCVAPGPVYTPMVIRNGMSEQARAGRRNASPLKIEGEGWDIGNAVTFLLSDRARYITGQTLVVDGGCTIVGPARESDH